MLSMLDDTARLKSADPSDMLGYLHRLPEVAEPAFRRAQAVALPLPRPRQVVICGMGGSAISGDLARNLVFSTSEVPLVVSRHNGLPASTGTEDLVILLSYSGNTAETLGCLEDAIARSIPCVLVTSGGKFGQLAKQHGLATVPVESGWMPRAALGELYFSLLGLISQLPGCGWISPEAVVRQLRAERATYGLDVPIERNPAKQIASKLAGKRPVIFGVHPSTEAVAMRWKAQINENSKMTALMGVFPELTHNEIVNLAHAKHDDHVMVVLRDPADHPFLQRQLGYARDIMAPMLDEVVELVGGGEDPLSRQLSLAYLGDWVSVYLALMAGVDPTPVEAIFGLKDRMALSEEVR
ncbi:bifunctional phosphoglucose/phosphomannose isomerase [bacterium]|nr:bifunctional phosphoglucose/phosphomannose isomerase [bacterium]